MPTYVRIVAVVVVFSLVAFLGAFIKLGGAAASIALDSWAGFFVAAFFGPVYGGLVATIGHLLSAATGGFPFTPPVHILIAVMQFAWAFTFGLVVRSFNNHIALAGASLLAIALNGAAAPLIIGLFFPDLMSIMVPLIPVLLIASAVNVGLASLVLLLMRRARQTT